jgi:signal transduction histidine kinase
MVDIKVCCEEAIKSFELQARQKGLELHLHPLRDSLKVETDPRLIRIILNNLIENALKYTVKGSVDVSVGSDGEEFFLRVRDTGPGIAPEDRHRVFEAFEQLEPLKRKSVSGVGLGLALVREIVQLQDGRVDLDSELGKGSTFTVWLKSSSAAVSR